MAPEESFLKRAWTERAGLLCRAGPWPAQPLLRLFLVVCLGAGLGLPSSSSTAAPARDAKARAMARARAAESKAALGKKKDAGFDASLTEKLERQSTGESHEQGPTLRFEQFRRGVQLQVAAKRREQIETLSKIVKLGGQGADTADLLFRLAELYWEEAQFFFFQANEKDDEIVRAGGDTRKIAGIKREQAQLTVESRRYRKLAVARYRDIVRNHTDYPRLDEVLFSLGSNLWEEGESRAALKAYQVLVRRYKKSEYVPDAFLAFGEFFFNNGDIRKALQAYQRAAAFTESKVYGFAMYKQGWCHYNLGNFDKALDLFKAVVFYGDIASSVSGQNKIALVKEARRDYVLAYSQVGDPKAAREQFKLVGGETAPKMIRSLANLYYDTGKDREAIYTYRTLIKEQPLDPDSPGFQARIVDAAQRIGNKAYTVKQVRLLSRLFAEVKKAGVIKTKKEKQKMAKAGTFAERTIRTLALTWNQEAKKTRDEDVYGLSKELYSDYLKLFPGGKFEYQMRFYYAELLYGLEFYEEAAKQYTGALKIDIARLEGKRLDAKGIKEKPGKYLVDAAFNAVLSYEEVARKFEESETRPQVPATTEIKIPAPKKALLEACGRYQRYVPKGEKVVEITYKIANIFYRYNHFEEAVKRFVWIAEKHPSHELAEVSANLVLDSYVLLGKPKEVNHWARRFLKNPILAKGKLRKDLKKVIEDSALTLVEAASKSGKFAEAAQAYEGFVKEFPHSKKADRALYNASVSWAKAGHLDKALALRARIIHDYPASELVPAAVFSTAKGYESFASFAKAAVFYELYAQRFQAQRGGGSKKANRSQRGRGRRRGARHRSAGAKKRAATGGGHYEEGKAQEALYNAAILRQGLGQFSKARGDRQTYIKLWPKAKDTKTLSLSIADLYERASKFEEAVAALENYLATYASKNIDENLVLRLRMARLLERSRNRKVRARAARKYDEIRGYYAGLKKRKKRVKRGLEAVATVELMDLAPIAERYRSLKLEYPWKERRPPKELFAFVESVDKMKITTQRQLTRLKKKIKLTTDMLKRGVRSADQAFKNSAKAKADELKKVIDAYTRIVKFKQGEPALCALEKMGGFYIDYVKTLKTAPLPPYLRDEEQTAMFRSNLEQEALPVEDKAIEAYSTAVKKSQELGIYNRCAARGRRRLRELRPDAWPAPLELVPPLALALRSPPQGGDFLDEIQAVPKRSSNKAAASVPELPPAKANSASQGAVANPRNLPNTKEGAQAGRPSSKEKGRGSIEDAFAEPDDEDLLP